MSRNCRQLSLFTGLPSRRHQSIHRGTAGRAIDMIAHLCDMMSCEVDLFPHRISKHSFTQSHLSWQPVNQSKGRGICYFFLRHQHMTLSVFSKGGITLQIMECDILSDPLCTYILHPTTCKFFQNHQQFSLHQVLSHGAPLLAQSNDIYNIYVDILADC